MYNTPQLIINSRKSLHCKDLRENSAFNKIVTRKILKPVGSPCRSPLGHIAEKQSTTESRNVPESL